MILCNKSDDFTLNHTFRRCEHNWLETWTKDWLKVNVKHKLSSNSKPFSRETLFKLKSFLTLKIFYWLYGFKSNSTASDNLNQGFIRHQKTYVEKYEWFVSALSFLTLECRKENEENEKKKLWWQDFKRKQTKRLKSDLICIIMQ